MSNVETLPESELRRLERIVDLGRSLRAARETLETLEGRRERMLELQRAEVRRLETEFAAARGAS